MWCLWFELAICLLPVGAVGGTPLQDMAAKKTQKPKDSNSNVKKPSVSRQGSQDSHNSGQLYVTWLITQCTISLGWFKIHVDITSQVWFQVNFDLTKIYSWLHLSPSSRRQYKFWINLGQEIFNLKSNLTCNIHPVNGCFFFFMNNPVQLKLNLIIRNFLSTTSPIYLN